MEVRQVSFCGFAAWSSGWSAGGEQRWDPLIFGRIVDRYVLNPEMRPEGELVRGALGWLLVAAAVALAARLAGGLQDYALRLLTQKVGTEMFDDGLRQDDQRHNQDDQLR
jgi:hypothetical protein